MSKHDHCNRLNSRSPGGSALASELIWRAVGKAKESSGKPLIASFSDVAASGGYYAAVAADEIVVPRFVLKDGERFEPDSPLLPAPIEASREAA